MRKISLAFFAAMMLQAGETEDLIRSMNANYAEHVANQNAIKQEYAQMLKANARYYENIYQSARRYYSQFLAENWGEGNVKLSDKKQFTQYDESLTARQTVDYEKGKVTLEVVVDKDEKVDPKKFQKKLEELKKQTIAESRKKDPVNKLAASYMKKKKIVEDKPDQETSAQQKLLDKMFTDTTITKENIKEKEIRLKDGKKKKIVSVEILMVPNHLEKRAKRYKERVMEQAKRFDLEPSYIFGVIQTESFFNPLAVSPIPAYGLMQIVPTSAGIDAYQALKGKKRLLPPAYLYDPNNNIELGSQYLNIIRTRYLKGVENPQSLDYCAATAYNAGIGNVYRVFTGKKSSRKAAVEKINAMTPEQVYETLRTSKRLVEEAHNYVKRVNDYKKNYESWDQGI